MSPKLRPALLALAALAILPGFWRVACALPGFGSPVSPYGQAVNALLPEMRRVSNMVSAINFDVRGFDTIGEEFMLLAAVAGTVLLLRGGRGEDRADAGGRIGGRAIVPRADAVVLICRICGPFTFIFGVYVALHAMATPGGGFQGGVVIASSLLLIYLGEGYGRWRQLVREPVLDAVEGAGALLFVAAGLLPVFLGLRFLTNVLPFGTAKDMLSGGLMIVENAGVTLAVAGGFGTVLLEFMEETRATTSEVADPDDGRTGDRA
ncbi:sodium:proton antiporter [Lichenibacterium minor]|jgi:multicomponent Na+:H+ antiporter subunit B|uniref:Sodium:proton antiporter n=1 Tax=Lichenibacterium minor TaxID=2316528 RepID=A0A4Q2U6L0_9HYPH|nr:MnhB domain-containing protein [Lichenibacterium minor]RYC32289.1 sodium:proton antiporter [Lichenibacterium minor]